ncbi:hypothetical protein JAAARDRAFT_198748 [Jaapia argillacea MUCL 33604]|uniref:Uncharacterized protein n=1 Tax=Jaapia argillacea MUCL 33604 TaxID=933084 RepID=A0A067PAS8_9AGAM|nr:hypothetical protein JAAARDRAFT_198748 [Jaapia argillacea MUCL 33604]
MNRRTHQTLMHVPEGSLLLDEVCSLASVDSVDYSQKFWFHVSPMELLLPTVVTNNPYTKGGSPSLDEVCSLASVNSVDFSQFTFNSACIHYSLPTVVTNNHYTKLIGDVQAYATQLNLFVSLGEKPVIR